jgi:aminoglycoside phosphotransferase (APT) family kinase protein
VIGLAPDPVVPQRDELLDPDAVARLLDVRGGRRTYAKYRLGESLRVVHCLDGRHVAARTFPDGESDAAYERALETAVPAGPLPPVVHAPRLRAVLWTFPNDRKLASLPLLVDGSPELTRLLGRPCRTRLVAYATERSASAECLDEAGRVIAYAKVYAHATPERTCLDAAARAGVRVPRVLAASERAVVLEPIAGRRLDALPTDELAAALRRLGAALAALHAHAPVPPTAFTRLAPERLARAVAVIARGRPDAGGPAARVLAALLERPGHQEGPAVCLHGDANLRNAILTAGPQRTPLGRAAAPKRTTSDVALLDLEDAAAGPAAADLGQVLAGLLTSRVRGEIDERTERALGDALLAGYEDPPAWDSVRWHTAASVLARIALPAVNRVRPDLLPRLRPLLQAAEALPV